MQAERKISFNTSYVVIKHLGRQNMQDSLFSFNTSYVVIKLPYPTSFARSNIVSIHLMLLLNVLLLLFYYFHIPCFNTSYVVIKLFFSIIFKCFIIRFNTSYVVIKREKTEWKTYIKHMFQYILCCY